MHESVNENEFVQSGSGRHIWSAVPPYIWTVDNLPLSLRLSRKELKSRLMSEAINIFVPLIYQYGFDVCVYVWPSPGVWHKWQC